MRRTFMNSETAGTTILEMDSRYPRMPMGHSIKGCGRLRTTTELSLQWDILQKQDQVRIICSQAITEDAFISRKIELFGQIRFTLLGIERRDSKQPKRSWQFITLGFHHSCMGVRFCKVRVIESS